MGAKPIASNSSPNPLPVPVYLSSDIRTRAQDKVFQLITRVKMGTEKQSYGTAFVVDPQGLLLTNYHVVSNVFLEPSQYVLELKLGEDKLPVQIVALDIPNDLAFIQVKHTFTDAYKLSATLPKPGEKLFSIGVPQDTVLTIIEGLYSGERKSGPVTRLIFSAPLNQGMSGGPLVNEQEELVGVNDAILAGAQNISFAIPGAVATQIFDSFNQSGRIASELINKTSLQKQVGLVLKSWLEEWILAQKEKKGPRFGPIHIGSPPPGSKCWEDEQKLNPILGRIGVYTCKTLDTFPISSSRQGGFLSLSYGWIPADSKSSSFLAAQASRFMFSTLSKKMSEISFKKATQIQNEKGRYVCSHRYVKSVTSEKLLVEFCTAETISASKLFDLLLTAIPSAALTHHFPFYSVMELHGFTEETLKTASEIFLSSISSSEKSEVVNTKVEPK